MNWAQLIAALAACGGLRTGVAVDSALREAAAAPERDFRQLIDVVRAAISEQINNGRLPEQRRYISLSAIYSDRAVIELDGKHFQYTYSFKHVAGSDQVVLGLSEAHLRLARVFIENKPYDQVIQRFDKPGTFFYVDPPYWDCEKDYGEGLFSKDDFARIAALLGAVKGKFIVSLNDNLQGVVLFALYVAGILSAMAVAAVAKLARSDTRATPLMMELCHRCAGGPESLAALRCALPHNVASAQRSIRAARCVRTGGTPPRFGPVWPSRCPPPTTHRR